MRERTAALVAATLAVVVALSRVPALLVAAGGERPPERVFLGFEADTATLVDLHYYASFVYEARATPRLLLSDRATTEPQEGRVLSLYFTGLGLFARLTGLSIPTVWNIARVLVPLLFFAVLWLALGAFLPRGGPRLLAFALVAVGGGLGWMMVGLRELAGEGSALPLADLAKDGVIGYSTFGYLYHPQALLAETCFLGAVVAWARFRESGRRRYLVLALVVAAFVFPMHGPSSPVFYAALLAAPFVPLFFRLELGSALARLRAVGAFAIPAGLAAAYVLWARGDPVFRGFADTYARLGHLREPIFWYPVGYGVVLLLAVVGLPRALVESSERRDFLLGWALAALVFSLNPLLFAWKFQFALHVPLCILAAHGAPFALERLGRVRLLAGLRARPALAGGLLVAFAGISSLLLFGATLARASEPALYASAAELEALDFLARQPVGNVLSRYRSGQLVIQSTPHKAYFAHYTGTLDPDRKEKNAHAFFREDTPTAARLAVLREGRIRYVFYGPRERELGPLPGDVGLRHLYANAEVEIAEVPP